MTIKTIVGVLAASSLLTLSACTNTVQYGEATRVETTKIDVSSNELVTVAEKMTRKMLTYPTVEEALKKKRPKLAISPLINQTSDDSVDVSLIEDSIAKQLGQSGKFSFSDKTKTKAAQSAVTKDQLFASIDINVAKKIASNLKADYLLYGSLKNIIRTKATSKEVYYSFNLHMLDTKTGKLVWQDSEEILKSRKKAIFGI
ncbi:penicillin-binding protein activator LpoB [Gammaproteobacteria bacterium 42_54_T18]|nr:penicillin-binding protein activator LpoB [Gammaproteobacteria bacterium 42_54_T18]